MEWKDVLGGLTLSVLVTAVVVLMMLGGGSHL